MSVITEIIRSIKAALVGAFTDTKIKAPVRVKLAGRNGYGNDGIPPPGP
jgi:hypothetical protein